MSDRTLVEQAPEADTLEEQAPRIDERNGFNVVRIPDESWNKTAADVLANPPEVSGLEILASLFRSNAIAGSSDIADFTLRFRQRLQIRAAKA